MTDNAFNSIRVQYSTPHVDTVAAFLSERYDLPGDFEVKFLCRGFNDSFEIVTRNETLGILRLSGWRGRGPADVASETDFLAFLDTAGVPVAAPITTLSGELFSQIELPQGRRSAVLFRYAEGEEPGYHSTADAEAQGVTMARIHAASNVYPRWNSGRYDLDLNHLLHRPLASVSALGTLPADSLTSLSDLAVRLSSAVAAIEGLTRVRCHGDCHGGNARIATEGRFKGEAIFFDFDDGGPGYLAYDLAVFLWSASLHRNGYSQWHAFVEGYRSVRRLNPIDYEAAHLFVPIRHFWLMGEYASRTVEWGREAASEKWLHRQLEYLLSWEQERLLPKLF